MRIAIIDYGMGNLYSVEQALKRLGADVIVTNDLEQLNASEAYVLPGVGAFPDAMTRLRDTGLATFVQSTKKPLLGICLGMQLMFERSDEVRPTDGLGIFKGRIQKFKDVPRIPHMGWNQLTFTNEEEIEDGFVYFVHSFYGVDLAPSQLVAYANYGDVQVPAVVAKDNYTGMQFHPEKSSKVGMTLLEQWLQKVGATC